MIEGFRRNDGKGNPPVPSLRGLISNFDNFHLAYDPEDQAKKQAENLAFDIASLGGKVKVWNIGDTDPGDLSQEDADEFMRLTLGRTGY